MWRGTTWNEKYSQFFSKLTKKVRPLLTIWKLNMLFKSLPNTLDPLSCNLSHLYLSNSSIKRWLKRCLFSTLDSKALIYLHNIQSTYVCIIKIEIRSWLGEIIKFSRHFYLDRRPGFLDSLRRRPYFYLNFASGM